MSDPAVVEIPWVANESDWRDVKLRVMFNTVGEVVVVSVDTEDLTMEQEKHLDEWLRVRA